MAKREGRERKKNAKRRGRVKEDNPCIKRWIYVSVEMQKRSTHSLRMYTTDVFSLSYLKKKESLSKVYITLFTSEFPFHLDQCRLVISINFTTLQKFTKIIKKPFRGFSAFYIMYKYNLRITLLYLRTFRKRRKAEQYEECRRDWQRYRKHNYNDSALLYIKIITIQTERKRNSAEFQFTRET